MNIENNPRFHELRQRGAAAIKAEWERQFPGASGNRAEAVWVSLFDVVIEAIEPELTALATKAVRIVVVMPGFGALQSWFQGVLVHSRRTRGITESVVIYLGANLVLLTLGMRFVHAPGIFVGLGAVVGAAVCQLFWLWRRSRPALQGLAAGGSRR